MTKTPGYNSRLGIAFTADKNGRQVAYYWSRAASRWIKMGLDEAKLHVAAGDPDRIEYRR